MKFNIQADMVKPILSFLAAFLLLSATHSAAATTLRDGDIIFQTSRSAQSLAIQQATRSRFSHVGLVFHRDGRPYVFEAVGPVKYTPLAAWTARGEGGQFVVRRLRAAETLLTPTAVARLRREAERLEGRPYDPTFEWSDTRLYCSELVWKVYERALGLRLGRLQRLRDFDLAAPAVQALLRQRYGDAIPFDETVVSPQALFSSEALVTVAQE